VCNYFDDDKFYFSLFAFDLGIDIDGEEKCLLKMDQDGKGFDLLVSD